MFGRRSNDPSLPKRAAPQSTAPQAPVTPVEPKAAPQLRQAQAAAASPRPEPVIEPSRKHSEEYYDVKTTVFTASGKARFGMLLEPAAAQAEDSPSDACCAVMASSSPSAT